MNPIVKFWLGLRATLFWIGFASSTIVYGLLIPLVALLPSYHQRYDFILTWNRFNLWWLKVTCGVRFQVRGRENIPQGSAAILMANHQSTWETMSLATIFPPATWVFKKELLRIPFFGWGLRLLDPIAVDRGAGRSAVEQVKVQGKERLDRGIWVVIFPEGTRVQPGKKVRYKMGGAVLAEYAQYPVVPVAHNAGESWPRLSYIKKPGTITVSIGQPIETAGLSAKAINEQVAAWIDTEKANLPPLR